MAYSSGDIAFLRGLRKGMAWARENPQGRLKLDWCTSIPAADLPSYVRGRIHSAISARGGDAGRRGRRDDPDHRTRLFRDQRAISDYRRHRIVQRGSGLETPEGRRVAPDVHEAFRARY